MRNNNKVAYVVIFKKIKWQTVKFMLQVYHRSWVKWRQGARMSWHHVIQRVWENIVSWCRPVWSGRGKEPRRCRWHRSMGVEIIQSGGGVSRHPKHVLLISVGCCIRCGRCHSLCEANEIKLVSVPFAMDLCHDILVVVVPQSSTELVIVHIGLGFPLPPSASHFIGVDQLEFAVTTLPCYASAITSVW